MYCDNCGTRIEMDVHEFVSRKQNGEEIECGTCTPAWVEQLEAIRPSAGTA